MNAKKQCAIHILFLSALVIVSGFSNCMEGETLKNANTRSVVNPVIVQDTVKTNDSAKYMAQLRELLERLAELYQELKTYVEQYSLVEKELRDAGKAYDDNPSTQTQKRFEALENDARRILARIRKIKSEINELENVVIPNVKSKLSKEKSDASDSRKDDILDTIDSIKSEINQIAGQYPEVDALINGKLKYKAPIIKQKPGRRSINPDN